MMAGKFRDTQQTLLTLEQNMPYRLSVLSNKVSILRNYACRISLRRKATIMLIKRGTKSIQYIVGTIRKACTNNQIKTPKNNTVRRGFSFNKADAH